jgi:hypothetical protein
MSSSFVTKHQKYYYPLRQKPFYSMTKVDLIMAMFATVKGWLKEHKGKALMLIATISTGLVSAASAATIDLNATLGPLLDSIAALIPSIVSLLIALVPLVMIGLAIGLVIALIVALIGMIEGVLDISFKPGHKKR